MSFPKYPRYRDSSNGFLGEIPTTWDVWKLSHVFPRMGSGTTPRSDNPEYYDGGTIPWVNTGDLNDGALCSCTKAITQKALDEYSSLKMYPRGSVLFAMYGATIGKLGILEMPATVNQACCVFFGEGVIDLAFLFYWFMGLREQIVGLATGGGQPNVSQDILRTLKVACPSISEQRIIAAFLDRDTAKIDSLVAEQRRLIELLKEKRQAVISHAVTKGLNPDVRMKPSGIEWLGDVPEHWEVAPLKRRAVFITSGSRGWADFYADAGALFLRIGNLTRDSIDIDLSDIQRVTVPDGTEGARTQVQPGDVLFSVTADLGSVAVVPKGIEEAYVSQHIALVRLDTEGASPRWVGYAALSNCGKTWFSQQAYGGTKIQLSLDDVLGLPMTFPSLDEQIVIAEWIDTRVDQFAQMQKEAERAITLLQERRTALISAAVTGKIDVRGLAPTGEVA